MDLKISYEDLLEIIKQLPLRQLARLKGDLTRIIKRADNKEDSPNELQNLLKKGPTMSDEQYEEYLAMRFK
jgi:hypothetical protein